MSSTNSMHYYFNKDGDLTGFSGGEPLGTLRCINIMEIPKFDVLRKSRRKREAKFREDIDKRIKATLSEASSILEAWINWRRTMTHDQITELLMNMTDDKLLSMNKEIVAPFLGSKLQSHVETEKAKEELPYHHRNVNLGEVIQQTTGDKDQ